jgi:hypothetical protein
MGLLVCLATPEFDCIAGRKKQTPYSIEWGFCFLQSFVLAEEINFSMPRAVTQEAHDLFFFLPGRTKACLNKQDRECAICTGMSIQTLKHVLITSIELY